MIRKLFLTFHQQIKVSDEPPESPKQASLVPSSEPAQKNPLGIEPLNESEPLQMLMGMTSSSTRRRIGWGLTCFSDICPLKIDVKTYDKTLRSVD